MEETTAPAEVATEASPAPEADAKTGAGTNTGLLVFLSTWHETMDAPVLPRSSLVTLLQREGTILWPPTDASGSPAPGVPGLTPDDVEALLGGMHMLRACGAFQAREVRGLPRDAASLLAQCVVLGVPTGPPGSGSAETLALGLQGELKHAVHVFWTHTIHCPPRQAVALSEVRGAWSAARLAAGRPAALSLTACISEKRSHLMADFHEALQLRDAGPHLRALVDCALPAHYQWLPLTASTAVPFAVRNTGQEPATWRLWACRIGQPFGVASESAGRVAAGSGDGSGRPAGDGNTKTVTDPYRIIYWPPEASAFATALMYDLVAHKYTHGGRALVDSMLNRHLHAGPANPSTLLLEQWRNACVRELRTVRDESDMP